MRWRVVQQVARTAFVEFWRSPAAVFWTYGFPLMMAVVLGFSFQPSALPPVPIGIVSSPAASVMLASINPSARLDAEIMSPEDADAALARGRIALLIKFDAEGPVLRCDPTRPESELAQLLVERALQDAQTDGAGSMRAEVEDRPGSRYIDFLIPGLIGINLMGAGMWGVGFNLVQMRVQNLLRRLFVTPMRRSEFLAGYLLGRSILVIPEAIAIVVFGVMLWGVPFRGSYMTAFLAIVIGSWTFTGLGVLCASRARTIETISGLMNAVQLPMWILGGTFFANEALEGPVRWVAECLPLTHINRTLRDLMLEPGTLADVWLPLAVLAAFGLCCFGLAMRLFRWQ